MNNLITKSRKRALELFKFIIVWLIILLCLKFVGVRYHNNDDFDMVLMVKGIFPFESDSFLFYSSLFLGKIYQFLYSYLDLVEWYVVIYVLLTSFSLVLMCRICFFDTKEGYKKWIIPIVLLLMCIGFKLLTQIQFTYAAGILTVNGLIIYFKSIINKGKNKETIIIAFIFLTLGSLYRFDMFLLVLLTFSTYVFFLWVFRVRLIDFYTFRNYRGFGLKILVLILPFCVPVLLHLVELKVRSSEQLQYAEFQQKRSKLHDNALLERTDNKEEILELVNWGEPEESLFFNWIIPDIPEMSNSSLQKMIKKANNRNYLSVSSILNEIRIKITDLYYMNSNFLWALVLSVIPLLMLLSKENAIKLLTILLITLIILLCVSLLFKRMPARVFDPLMYLMIISNWVFALNEINTATLKTSPMFPSVVGLVFLFLAIQTNRYKSVNYFNEKERISNLDSTLLSMGYKYYISCPENYPAYFHDCGFIADKSQNRPKIFHTGPFQNHPANVGFLEIWKWDRFLKSVNSEGVPFYFSRKNFNQLENVKSSFEVLFKEKYNMEVIGMVAPLSDIGWLLILRVVR